MRSWRGGTWFVWGILAMTAWLAPAAADDQITKKLDRLFPVGWCPIESRASQGADLSFVAPSPTVRLTFSGVNRLSSLQATGFRLDNIALLLRSDFEAHLVSPVPGFDGCYDPAINGGRGMLDAPAYDFLAPGVPEVLLDTFASGTAGWTGPHVHFEPTDTAPTDPVTGAQGASGSLGLGDDSDPSPVAKVSATKIVGGLVPGQEYTVFAWEGVQEASPLTLTISTPCPLGSSGCTCVRRSAGIQGWWPGASSGADLSTAANHGVPTGGTTFAAGAVGQAFQLDGVDDHVGSIGATSSYSFIQNTGVFTIDAWIDLTDPNALRQQAITANTGTTVEKGHFFLWDNSGGQRRLRLGITNGTDGVPVIDSTSPPNVITTPGWHHVAVTGDGTSVTFWVDGVGAAGTGTIGTLATGSSSRILSLGRCPAVSPQCQLAGKLDEVRIHDRTLGPDELLAIFDAGSAGVCWCTDSDRDGYGAEGGLSCPAGTQQDCDDTTATVHPGGDESRCNGIDDDCDGQTDEGFPGACQCSEAAADLVGWWPGDGSASDVRGGNHGTLQAGAAYAAGNVGQSFQLDGIDDHVGNIGSAATYSFIQNSGVFTIAAWIQLDDPGALAQQAITGNTSSSAERGHFFIWENTDGLRRLRVGLAKGVSGVLVIDSTSPPNAINTSGWHHVAAIGDGSGVTFYVDGVASAGSGSFGAFGGGDSTRVLNVGRCNGATIQCPFDGRIDEVQIHRRALGASEIAAIHAAGSVGMCRCTDADDDGYGAEGGLACPRGTQQDCNDLSSAIRPGGSELCNGVDDDCDGQFDDGLPQSTFYRDADGDAFGNPAVGVQSCAAPAGYVSNGGDCNDASASIRPGVSDANCNGVDENCSGAADEEFVSPPDGWHATPLALAPSPRSRTSMVATGSGVIVWGGSTASGDTNTGGRFTPGVPGAEIWSPTSTAGAAPTARSGHTAVWTGSEMIVWGGIVGTTPLKTGGRYNRSTDAWTATFAGASAPAGRHAHTAIWTGSKMIVWGGLTAAGASAAGGVYDPATDSWTATATLAAPSARYDHTAVWTGTEMIVWGGYGSAIFSPSLDDGARYNPSTNSWSPLPNAPIAARGDHTAVWTGSQMIIFGGDNGSSVFNSGAIYDRAVNAWVSTFSGGVGRTDHTAVWDPTSGRMIVWGGDNFSIALEDGAGYDPVAHSWTSLPPGPAARTDHVAVRLAATGELVVWGGLDASMNRLSSGGRIVPFPFVCGVGACVRPSAYTCTAGAIGYTCTPGAAQPETCNGADDDCDGAPDDGIAPPSGAATLRSGKSGLAADLSWTAVAGGTGYDVVTGDLSVLRSGAGNFVTATTACLGDDLAGTSLQSAPVPASGGGFWYLVRAVNCGGGGSYDEGVPSQQGSRDAEILLSGAACP